MPSSGYTAISFTAGEQPTTAKWNLVGSNDASFNTGNGFNDGIIVNRHLATNAVDAPNLTTGAITLGYAQITSSQSIASPSGQVTGLTVTVTIPSGGRRTLITVYSYAVFNSAASGNYGMNIWDGAVGGTQLQAATLGNATGASSAQNLIVPICLTWSGIPAAGTKTYNVGAFTGAGNITISAAATNPAFILVQAI